MTDRANLISLATAVPPHRLPQTEAAERTRELFAHRLPDFGRIARVFKSTGIEFRYLVKPIDWYLEPWAGRSAMPPIWKARRICSSPPPTRRWPPPAARPPRSTRSSPSPRPASPRPASRRGSPGRMGFRTDVERVPVFGLGCAGGVIGPGDRQPARARRGRARRCCWWPSRSAPRPSGIDQLTQGQHGRDRAVRRRRGGLRACAPARSGLAAIEGAGEHLWPDTLDIMGWKVDPTRPRRDLRPRHPALRRAATSARPSTASWRASAWRATSVDRFACHPGGAKVITALEATLRLDQGTLDHERAVLRRLRQHVGADRAVRARPASSPAGCRSARC